MGRWGLLKRFTFQNIECSNFEIETESEDCYDWFNE
jgi:hypothetical protein